MTSSTFAVGMSLFAGKPDFADLHRRLDEIEALGIDSIELPTFEMDVVVGGRIIRPQLARLKAACAGRKVGWTVHGPLAINLMDEPHRLSRHMQVLTASLEAAAEVGAGVYVLHTGHVPLQLNAGVEAAYARQREWFARAGDIAAAHRLIICVENVFDWTWGTLSTASASRLAREIAAVDHPAVRATVDFSHAALEAGSRGGDFLSEAKALTPLARHLHLHDSFGRPDDIYMFTDGERLAFGHGDLHLPVGWGDLPWDRVMEECRFVPGTVFNIELNRRHWRAAAECVAAVRELAGRARIDRAEAD